MGHDVPAIDASTASHEEAEPARMAIQFRFRQEELVTEWRERVAQVSKILASALYEVRELLQLRAADGSLHVCDAEVHPKVRVDVFVVVALRQFAVLAIEAMAAVVVLAGSADTVAAPVAEGTKDFVQ